MGSSCSPAVTLPDLPCRSVLHTWNSVFPRPLWAQGQGPCVPTRAWEVLSAAHMGLDPPKQQTSLPQGQTEDQEAPGAELRTAEATEQGDRETRGEPEMLAVPAALRGKG